MKRHERAINDPGLIEEIIRRSQVCRLAMSDGEQPYVVPVNFGYSDRTVYVHCAQQGRKVDILRRNPRVCLEFDVDDEVVLGGKASNCTSKYRSVLAFGVASLVDNPEAKRRALDILMAHYTTGTHVYEDKVLARTLIIRIDISEMTGKQNGFSAEE